MTNAAISLDSARRHTSETVKQSGTSFAAGMRILSKPRRDAMYAIYAFCREVDDIADEGGTRELKIAGLAVWREEVDRIFDGNPKFPTGVALREAVEAFDLPKDEFFAMIEGMEIDANGPVVAPSMEELLHYTRCVAGSVGMLSMPAFGAPKKCCGGSVCAFTRRCVAADKHSARRGGRCRDWPSLFAARIAGKVWRALVAE